MSFRIYTPAGNPVDLGGTFDLLFAFRAMGHVEDDERFHNLFAIPQMESETLTKDDAKKIGQQARDFLARNKDSLSENAQWVLQQLGQVDSPLDDPIPGERRESQVALTTTPPDEEDTKPTLPEPPEEPPEPTSAS